MNLYELTKKYGEGKGEGMMWKTLRIVSDAIENDMGAKEKKALIRKIYGAMSDKHYNAELAHEDVSGMYYTDDDGRKHSAPYWPEEDVKNIYEENREEIPDYNFWDYFVTANMIKSDNACMLHQWFPDISEDEMNEKVAEMTTAWLKDEDWPTKTKIWDYLSAR